MNKGVFKIIGKYLICFQPIIGSIQLDN